MTDKIKITDLDTVTDVAQDDWTVVVDVSDTTQSADGTTKKARKSELKGLNWQGAWSAGSYAADDAVEHNGNSYVATVTTTGEPGVSADWSVLAQKGSDGNTLLNGTTDPDDSTDGANGDFYYRTDTKVIFGPKAGGAWPAGVALAAANTVGDLGNLGSSEALDFDGDTYQHGILDDDITLTFANSGEGKTITLFATYDGIAQRTATITGVEWVSGSAPTMPTTLGRETVMTFVVVNSQIYGFHNTVAGGSGSGVSDHGALSGLTDDDHTQYVLITTGAGAPSTAPARIGAQYFDTTRKRLYIAFGTTDYQDWRYVETVANDHTP